TDVGIPLTLTTTVAGGTTPYGYAWSFGDGNSSSAPSGTHAFSRAGDYAPRVRVTDAVGSQANATVNVVVNPALLAAVVANSTSPVNGSSVAYTAIATGGTPPYAFWWSFDDEGSGTGASVSHTFATAGIHVATVEINDSVGGRETLRVTVDVRPVPPGGTGSASRSGYPPLEVGGIAAGTLLAGVAIGVLLARILRGQRRSSPGPGRKSAAPIADEAPPRNYG
ncbi:MAG: PKD domain-containing protein, partial [Thermoplasmata archaeon]